MASITLTDARIKALTPRRSRARHPRREAEGLRRAGCFRRAGSHILSTVSTRASASGKPSATPATSARGEARSRAAALLAEIKAGRPRAGLAGRHDLRGRRRGRLLQARAALEAAHAEGEPRLSPQSDPAAVRRSPDRGDHPAGRRAVVRVARRDAGRGGPVHADPVSHHARGGTHGLPGRGVQPLPRNSPLPAEGQGAVPVRRGDPLPCALPRRPRARASPGRRGRPAPSADRVPDIGDSHAPLDGLARRRAVPSGQQDRTPDRLAVAGRAGRA